MRGHAPREQDTVHRIAAMIMALAAGGCFFVSGPTSEVIDDEERQVCPADTPPPSDSCLEGQCGNELGVGRPCTKGGGQCDVFNLLGGEAGICVVDFADNTRVHCCSRPCSEDSECGRGAVCATNPANPNSKGCVPEACEGR